MVDLHQTEPGLPTGHRWLALSRWGMAWRAALAVGAAAGIIFGVLLLVDALSSESSSGRIGLLLGWEPMLSRVAVSALTAGLLGPWLRRFYPFSQALMFGVLFVAALFLSLELWGSLVLSGIFSLGSGDPWEPQFGLGLWTTAIFWAPNLLAASIGYGIAIWASNRFGWKRPAAIRS